MYNRALAVCAAVLAVGGHVLAGTNGGVTPGFSVNLVSVGGPSGLGMPLSITGGTIFQHPNGTDFPPDPSLFGDFPSLQWDSYVAIDPNGPAAPDVPSMAPDGVNGLDFSGTGLTGGWFSDTGVSAQVGPFPGFFAIFIGRVAVTEGAMVSAPLLGAMVEDEFGMSAIEGPLNQGDTDQPPNRGGGAAYDFRSTTTTVSFPNPFGASEGGFGDNRGAVQEITVDVYDFYLVRVPTPGAATLLALATGITMMPRRRR